MATKEAHRTYSLGQRRLPASRHPAAKRQGVTLERLRRLAFILRLLAGEGRVLAVALLPIAFLAAIIMAYNLPMLKVTQVEIVGAKALDVAWARAALRLEGKNLLSIDANMVEKVLRQQPAVREVAIRRQWPSKVVVQVQERRPFAFWQTPEGAFAVDEEGFVLAQSPAPGPLPAINAQEGGVRIGARVSPEALGLARDLLSRLAAETGAQPRQFHYSAAQGLSVATDQGWRAVFGDGRGLDSKLATLAAVLRVAKERKLEFQYVDLRFGERPFLR